MNSTCHIRQGEKEKLGVRCSTLHINRKNPHVSSEKATFLIPRPRQMELALVQGNAWQAARRECLRARTPSASVGSISVISVPLPTIFNYI